MARDSYGIPDNMFGEMPDELPALIGRIIMVWAVMEQHLHGLACGMALVPDTSLYGSAEQMTGKCREHLDALPVRRRPAVSSLLDEIDEAREKRNDVAHNLWPHPHPDRFWGWRLTRKGKKTVKVTVDYTKSDLQDLLDKVCGFVPRLEDAMP